MAKVSSKRQITLPIEHCLTANITAGDDVECFVDREGVISIVKKRAGAAKGLLKGIAINTEVTEKESLVSAIAE